MSHRARPRLLLLATSTLLAAVCLTPGAIAQEDPEDKREWDPLEKGLDANGDLYPVKYFTDDEGRLWMTPSPSTGTTDGKELVFGERLPDMRDVLYNIGSLGFLRIVFSGNQDLLSLTEAEYHFRQMKLPRTDVGLRQMLATPPEGKTPGLRRRAELDRVLAVRLLQQRGVKGAKAELERLAADASVSRLTRLAAKDALAQLLPADFKEPSAPKTEQAVLRAMPNSCHVVVTVDQTQVPRWPGLPHFARVMGNTISLGHIRAAGGTVSPATLAGAMKLASHLSLAPYELVRRVGNARVNRWTVALRFPDDGFVPLFWLRWDGVIPAARLKEELEGDQYEVEVKDNGCHVNVGDGMLLDFTAQHVTLRSAEMPMDDTGKDAEALLAAGFGKPALWVHVPDAKSLLDRAKGTPVAAALPKITKATLKVSFRNELDIDAQIYLPEGREAVGVYRQIETGLEMAATMAERAKKRKGRGFQRMVGMEQILLGMILENVELDESDDSKTVLISWKPGKLTAESILKMVRER